MPAAPAPAQVDLQLPPEFPALPDEVIQRFPALQQYQDQVNQWWNQLSQALTDAQQSIATVANNLTSQLAALQAQVDATAPGAFQAGSGLVATGTVAIVDDTGATHQALVK